MARDPCRPTLPSRALFVFIAANVSLPAYVSGLTLTATEASSSAWEARQDHLSPAAPAEPKQPHKIAMCVSGNLRTFTSVRVSGTIRPFLRRLGGSGLAGPTTEPDLFVYGTLNSAAAKKQYKFGFAPLNLTEESVVRVLKSKAVNVTAFELALEAEEVTEDNVDAYIGNRHECFWTSSGFWRETKYLTRSLNQLVHLQRCVDLVVKHEEDVGSKYDIFLAGRPDLSYYLPERNWFTLKHYEGVVMHQWDWFMALPRVLMSNLIDPGYARPLNCTPGEVCCRRVQSSEQMLEYLLGASMNLGGYSCKCSPRQWPTSLVDVGELVRTKRVFAQTGQEVWLASDEDEEPNASVSEYANMGVDDLEDVA